MFGKVTTVKWLRRSGDNTLLEENPFAFHPFRAI